MGYIARPFSTVYEIYIPITNQIEPCRAALLHRFVLSIPAGISSGKNGERDSALEQVIFYNPLPLSPIS
jgi:hypothetical protein